MHHTVLVIPLLTPCLQNLVENFLFAACLQHFYLVFHFPLAAYKIAANANAYGSV